MTKLKKAAIAVGFAVAGGMAQAATLDTTSAALNDGILNFTGIDWHSNGSALVQGFDLGAGSSAGDTDDFTIDYQGFAVSISGGSSYSNLFVAAPGAETGGYELTAIAMLNETATCTNDGCSSISITGTGTWQIFFDDSPDASQSAGSGFTDGTLILSGTFDSQLLAFAATAPAPGGLGVGGGTLFGTVDFTNNDFIDPDLISTTFGTTINFPGQAAPNFVPGANLLAQCGGTQTADCFVLQADAHQDFAEVPEPATLLLTSMGLLGLGWARRKSA